MGRSVDASAYVTARRLALDVQCQWLMGTHADSTTDGEQAAKQADQQAPERWEVDESRSRLAFSLPHLIFQQLHGEFGAWGGTLFLDRRQPSLSSVHLWVDLASIDTDSTERDEQIRSSEFFDVSQFPRATFKSTTIEVREGEVIIDGRLDLHGVIRDVELSITPIAPLRSASTGQRETFSMRAKIDRQAFGLHWNQDLDVGGVVVGDNVAIEARIEAVRSVDDK